jgi:hypothetical protein
LQVFDLDAVRAAKDEVAPEPKCIVYLGRKWMLPAKAPSRLVVDFTEGRVGPGMRKLLDWDEWVGDDEDTIRHFQADEFFDLTDTDQMLEFLNAAADLYGLSLGKPSASSNPSPNTSRRSRRTSNGSTGSTSGKRSGAKNPSRPADSEP